jgi:hypothetical protein
MLDWIAEEILVTVNSIPALFVAEGSPHFMVFRAMFALILIALIVFAIAMLRPLCSAIMRYINKVFRNRSLPRI